MNHLGRIFLCLILLFIVHFSSIGQTVTNYQFSPSLGTYTQIIGGTPVNLTGGLDNGYANGIPIGFSFYYNGAEYTSLAISANGFVCLGSDISSTNNFVNNLNSGNSPGSPRPIIAPLWDNLNFSNLADLKYLSTGSAPNRVFTVEWLNARWNSTAGVGGISFQLKLAEADGKIDFVYKSEVGSLVSPSASIGISNMGTGVKNFLCLSATGNFPSDTSTIFEYTVLNSKPADGQTYSFIPKFLPPIAPNNLSFNSVTSTTLNITWKDSSNSETYFLIYISNDNINFNLAGNVASTSTPSQGSNYLQSVSGLLPGTTYYFRVFACNEGSAPLNFSSATCTTVAGLLSGIKTICPSGCDYTSIGAACNDVRLKGVSGSLIFELTNTYNPIIESYPFSFGNLLTSTANSITLRPSNNVSTPIIFSTSASRTFEFNNTNYLTIDGKKGGVGTPEFIQICNQNSVGSAINFINGSENNTLTHCRVTGISTSISSGVINFLGTNSTIGNSNNSIFNCSIKDSIGTPIYAIYSLGNSTYPNLFNTLYGNNFSNYFNTSNPTYALFLSTGTNSWFIGSNHFFQKNTRTTALNTVGSIFINSGSDYAIYGNFFGGSGPNCGGSAYAINGTGSMSMINLNLLATSACVIQSNTFRNFNINLTGANHYFINMANGAFNVSGNTFGNDVSNNNIRFSSTASNILFAPINLNGGTSYGEIVVESNAFGSMSIVGTGLVNYRAINIVTAVSALNITNNNLGSLSIANSIVDSTAGQLYGIFGPTTASFNTINGNTLTNLSAINTATTTRLCGIYINSSGTFNVLENTINNLITTSTGIGTNANAPLIGILQNSTGLDQVCSGNNVSGLYLNNALTSNPIQLYGIFYSGSVSGTNILSHNYVQGIRSLSTGTSIINGIYNGCYGVSCFNNRVRLGLDMNGNPTPENHQIYGINDANSANAYYYNSVYITGSVNVTGSSNTAAFYNSTGATATRKIINNIFYNQRANVSGLGNHYAIFLTSTTLSGLSLDHNIYFAPAIGGILGRFNSVDYLGLNQWRSITYSDYNSGWGSPNFITPNSPTAQLKVQSPTPVEGAGEYIEDLEVDFEQEIRAVNSPSDIGADAGTFVAVDLFPPSILFNPLSNTASTSNRTLSVNLIDSGTRVTKSVSIEPRIWYRRSFPTISPWVSTPGILVAGNQKNGTWDFMIDYSIIGLPAAFGHRYQYYVVAQDSAPTPNLFYNPLNGANHSSVGMQISAPTTPEQFSIVINLSTNITVGAGQAYTTLTGPFGLFDAINNGALAGNTLATIVSNIIEPGTVSLTNAGMGGYNLRVKPDATPRVLSGAQTTSYSALIFLNGAIGVTIDGVSPGMLTIRNVIGTSTNMATTSAIRINNGKNDTIKNCIIESNSGNASFATLSLSTSNGLVKASDLFIKNNIIRPAFNDTNQTPQAAILINSSTGNISNTYIYSNEISDFKAYGIYLVNVGNNLKIGDLNDSTQGNKIYQRARQASNYSILVGSGSGHIIAHNAIYNLAGVIHTNTTYGIYAYNNINNIRILHNSFGGSNASRGGQAYQFNSNYYGILFAGGNLTNSIIDGNIFANFAGMGSNLFNGILVTAGKVIISNNTIGGSFYGTNLQDTISISNNFFGIRVTSTSPASITNNVISNINNNGLGYMVGMSIEAGVSDIKNNKISHLKTFSTSNVSLDYSCVGLRFSSATSGNNIENNYINNLQNLSTTSNVCVTGMAIVNSISNSNITRNRIFNLIANGTGSGALSPIIRGIYSSGRVNATFANNQITIAPNIVGTQARIRGIEAANSGASSNFFHNSIYIGGTTYGSNNSSAFYRNAVSSNAAIEVKNNIFYNERAGAGKHYSFSTNTNSAISHDYNLYVNTNLNTAIENPIGTSKNLSTWNAQTGNPSNNIGNTNIELGADQFFPNKSLGDLASSACVISNAGGYTPILSDFNQAIRSNPADLGSVEFSTATGKPQILSQSGNINVSCSPASIKIGLKASGFGIKYQWQEKQGSTWNNLSNTSLYGGTDSDTLTLTLPSSNLNGFQYRCKVSGSCLPADSSNAVTLTIANSSSWLGAVSTAWANAANWSCASIPSPSTDVIINNVSNLPIISDNNRSCHNLNIGTGANLSLNNSNSELSLYGNMNLVGLLNNSNGRIIFAGSQAQTIPAMSYNNISINNDSGVSLIGSVNLNGNLNFVKGNLFLDKYNFTLLGNSANISGAASDGKFFVSNDTGNLIIQNIGNSARTGIVEFPIGSNRNSYTPFTINNAGTADHFSGRVLNQVYPGYVGNATPNGTALSANVVNKTWVVKENVNGGSNAALSFQWNVVDEVFGFGRTNCYVSANNGSAWSAATGGAAVGINPYSRSINNVSSFNIFGVGSGGVLPVQLLHFKAAIQEQDVLLNWQTSNEINSKEFWIERSMDGENYSVIGSVAAAGNSNVVKQYAFNDQRIIPQQIGSDRIYYKLRMLDLDDKELYSPVVYVDLNVDLENEHTKVYPNPFGAELHVEIKLAQAQEIEICLYDLYGKLVSSQKYFSQAGIQHFGLNQSENLPKGLYFLTVVRHDKYKILKILKQ
ncbi:MAG: T9SS type A sorting domain-containing protein [bacterium]|nr:T9SS type A sorting domain-containing protein [bacterium]